MGVILEPLVGYAFSGWACLASFLHYLLSALCEPPNMYKLRIAIVMCCAFLPWGSAAPKTWLADPTSQPESNEERNERLQEELDSQENILSKVWTNASFYVFLFLLFCAEIQKIERGGKHMRPLLFVAAGWLWQSESPLGRLWLSV